MHHKKNVFEVRVFEAAVENGDEFLEIVGAQLLRYNKQKASACVLTLTLTLTLTYTQTLHRSSKSAP